MTECPACGHDSETTYRCDECQRDLVGVDEEDEVATDGGHEIDPTAWYVYDSTRDAVVAGPYDDKAPAAERVRDEGIDHLVVNGEALRSIEGDTRLVWETGDVDVVTDGGVAVSHGLRPETTVRPHADLLVSLPEPPETFIRQDVPDGHRDALQTLVHASAIEQVRRAQVSYDGDTSPSYRWRYRIEPWAYRLAAAQVRDRDAPMPCGHSGIRNLGGGAYTCCYDGCDLTYDRAEVAVDVE